MDYIFDSISVKILLFVAIAFQVYVIYLLIVISSNAARFALLLTTMAMLGSITVGFFPTGSIVFNDGYINLGFIKSDLIAVKIVLPNAQPPYYVYLILLVFAVVALLLVPRFDEANEKRRLLRAGLSAEFKRRNTGN